MNTPLAGATQEIDFKSTSGYAALTFAFLCLAAVPVFIFMRSPPWGRARGIDGGPAWIRTKDQGIHVDRKVSLPRGLSLHPLGV